LLVDKKGNVIAFAVMLVNMEEEFGNLSKVFLLDYVLDFEI